MHRRLGLPVVFTTSSTVTNVVSTNGSLQGAQLTNGNGTSLHNNQPLNNNNNINMTNSNNNGNLLAGQQQRQQQITVPWNCAIDEWWHELMAEADTECEPVWVDAEDPLFILYTRLVTSY